MGLGRRADTPNTENWLATSRPASSVECKLLRQDKAGCRKFRLTRCRKSLLRPRSSIVPRQALLRERVADPHCTSARGARFSYLAVAERLTIAETCSNFYALNDRVGIVVWERGEAILKLSH